MERDRDREWNDYFKEFFLKGMENRIVRKIYRKMNNVDGRQRKKS